MLIDGVTTRTPRRRDLDDAVVTARRGRPGLRERRARALHSAYFLWPPSGTRQPT
jgi:hypothetical protein